MGLFGINYRSALLNDKVASSIDKIKDENKLKKIVIDARNYSVYKYVIDKITDDNILYEIAMDRNINPDKSILALEKIADEAVLNRLASELPVTHRYMKIIYEKLDNPPFLLNFKISSKKASENLVKNIEEMEYPKDRDKLIMIAKEHSYSEAVKKAIDKLPYKEEVDELKSIFESSISDTAKECVINKLPIKEERDYLVSILMNGSNKRIIKLIASKLDKNDELLSKEVCTNCGALESVKRFGEYKRSIDEDVTGYRCDKCHKEVSLPNDMGEVKKFTMKLKEYINK